MEKLISNWKPQTFEDCRFLQSGEIPPDSKEERKIIVKMSTAMNFRWKPLDFWFINNASEVFSGLQKKGVITDEGMFNAAYRPVESLNNETGCKPFKP